MNLVPWLLVGELCPPKVRAISSAIAVTVCAISIFVVVKVCKLQGTNIYKIPSLARKFPFL